MDNNELVPIIALEQVPVIIERLHIVRDDIKATTAEACKLVCTDETYKDVKKVRADLAKQYKALEDQRKGLKAAILKPYEEFEKVYRECITEPFTAADNELKAKITDVENGLKLEKAQQIKAYYAELVTCCSVKWLSEVSYNPDITMSVSLKKLKEDATDFVNAICADVRTIGTMDGSTEILVEYRRNGFKLAEAIETVNERRAAIEAQAKAEQEERTRRAEQEKHVQEINNTVEAEKPAQAITEAAEFEPAQEAPKVYQTKFYVKGTIEQLKALKAFLSNGGYEYGSC